MSHTPLISIITATYNAEKHIQSAIDSIVTQTYTNFEFIVIDGGSNDKTKEILQNKMDHINYWVSEPDSGIYDAWNKGLNQAHGEWVLFLGADDQFLPDALESYVNYINNNLTQNLDFISSRVKRIRPDGSIENIVGQPWVWDQFKFRMTTAHPGSMHSKRLFEKYGTFNTRFKIVSDYEFLLRPKNNLSAGFLDKVTVLMSTEGVSNDLSASLEVLSMFKYSNHLSTLNYWLVTTDLRLRYYIKLLLKSIRNRY